MKHRTVSLRIMGQEFGANAHKLALVNQYLYTCFSFVTFFTEIA